MTPPGWGKTMGPCPTCEALARTVMLDQTSHDTKRQWQGLTAEERKEICRSDPYRPTEMLKLAEAKLKEKNT